MFVHADYDHVTGAGVLRVDASVAVWVMPALGRDVGRRDHGVDRVEPWSAELPRLYRLTRAPASSHAGVGFRPVTIEGDRLLVNGRRVLLAA